MVFEVGVVFEEAVDLVGVVLLRGIPEEGRGNRVALLGCLMGVVLGFTGVLLVVTAGFTGVVLGGAGPGFTEEPVTSILRRDEPVLLLGGVRPGFIEGPVLCARCMHMCVQIKGGVRQLCTLTTSLYL